MRKTLALFVATAFVATLPTIASAKKRHHRHQRAVAQVVTPDNGGHFITEALHQIFVPFEVTLGPRAN